jgi:hypothetical protein
MPFCDVDYKEFVQNAEIDKMEVNGEKVTLVTLYGKEYKVNGYHADVNIYKLLRNKLCHKCSCKSEKMEI